MAIRTLRRNSLWVLQCSISIICQEEKELKQSEQDMTTLTRNHLQYICHGVHVPSKELTKANIKRELRYDCHSRTVLSVMQMDGSGVMWYCEDGRA